jgi:hypothetical protein
MSRKPERKRPDDTNVVSVAFSEAEPPHPTQPAFDPDEWLTTKQLLERGWARQWLDMALGTPLKRGSALLWPKAKALRSEKNPAFAAACDDLRTLAKRVRYVSKEDEAEILERAVARLKVGEMPSADTMEITTAPPPAGPSDWPKSDWTADALMLTWPEGRVVVPRPFLEALGRGMGETPERVSFAMDTVLTDWRCARSRPEKLTWGRNYFLASVRNCLAKLQELEKPALQKPEIEVPVEPGRVLH